MVVRPTRIGIVGVGKIARDQHIPAIVANSAFSFVAVASRHAEISGVANFPTIAAMLEGMPDLDAVAICTPPQAHYEAAKLAIEHGKHVLLEKPPCTSLAQLENLGRLANARGSTLYQTWHSQHAHGVAPARRLLKARKLREVRIIWKEDVRQWHPGQSWIWEPGGFGVLDPGINALSILTKIVAEPIFAQSALLQVPSNCAAPIAAELQFVTDSGTTIYAALDFRHTGTQTWDIELSTDTGPIVLSAGGGTLTVGDESLPRSAGALGSEYEAIYRRFADLIVARESDVDARPLQLVADIFLIAKQISIEPFVH